MKLQGKALNHVFESPVEIFQSLRRFYVNETLKQIYKIIGSLDFVGNPTMLVSSFFSGFRDLVVTPSAAFPKSPTDPSTVGLGVAKGAISLLSHSTSGFFAFCAKVSASAGQAVATLSLDPDFSTWHRSQVVVEATNVNRQWKKRGMQSVQAMIARPLGDLVLGVAGGVFGVVLSPVKGYRRAGNAGLVRGVAVGCVGLIARPVVGVLDAFAHFTASIHDIAKSVNVLDRRLQPASRIRLPYTFGLMNVLMPFDDSRARATLLLKLFPLSKSVRATLEVPETVVHVEVLPNSPVDTYAIATTARVVLIRVKKETSGDLNSSLCWELCFTQETVISSRVADHGHSGVALTITAAKPADSSERNSETQRDTEASPSTPRFAAGLSSGLMFSQRNLDSASVERPVVDASKEFDHAKGEGVEGEPLEWFTVLAEYQYRRQLGRLHNAISCIVGDFNAVMYDPSLGCRGGPVAEGYTSFGIYHFSPEEDLLASSQKGSALFPPVLHGLPWVNELMFREARRRLPEQYSLDVSAALKDCGLLDYMEASRYEGGPEWLVEARARTLFMDTQELLRTRHHDQQTPVQALGIASAETVESIPEFPSQSARSDLTGVSWSRTNEAASPYLPATKQPEGRYESIVPRPKLAPQTSDGTHTSFMTSRSFRTDNTLPRTQLSDADVPKDFTVKDSDVFLSARRSEVSHISMPTGSADEAPVDASRQPSDVPPGYNTQWTGGDTHSQGMSTVYREEASSVEAANLQSSEGRFSSIRYGRLAEDSRQRTDFAPPLHSSGRLGNLTDKEGNEYVTPVLASERLGRLTEEEFDDTMPDLEQQESIVDPSQTFASETYHTLAEVPGDVPTDDSLDRMEKAETQGEQQSSTAPPDAEALGGDRMNRMETLMEKLLLFSTEQALQREQEATRPYGEDEIARLRQEISEFRAEQQRRTNVEANNAEVAALRDEVSWLRAHVQAGWQASRPAMRRTPTEASFFTPAASDRGESEGEEIEDVD